MAQDERLARVRQRIQHDPEYREKLAGMGLGALGAYTDRVTEHDASLLDLLRSSVSNDTIERGLARGRLAARLFNFARKRRNNE